MPNYYARNDEEREFDNSIRDSIKTSKSKSHMALYLQGQEELNLLRRIIENQEALAKDLETIHDLIKHSDILQEKYDTVIDSTELMLNIHDELGSMNMKLRDLMQYICESDNDDEEADEIVKSIKEKAKSYARLQSKKVKDLPEVSININLPEIWDYILCCLLDD